MLLHPILPRYSQSIAAYSIMHHMLYYKLNIITTDFSKLSLRIVSYVHYEKGQVAIKEQKHNDE